MGTVVTTLIPHYSLELRIDDTCTIGQPQFQVIIDGKVSAFVYAPSAGATSHKVLSDAVRAFNEAFNSSVKLEAAE